MTATNQTRSSSSKRTAVSAGVALLVVGIVALFASTFIGATTGARDDRAALPPADAAREGGTSSRTPAVDFECKPVREDKSDATDYSTPRAPLTEEVYPCTRCHDKPDDFNTTRRALTLQHTDIKLAHGPREQWCYGCHNPTLRDKLRLAGGRLIAFEKSYELCGQCHGPKLRDWRVGIHGRRIGCWNGKKQYLLCVHCHDPHAPAYPHIAPDPPPQKPADIGSGGEQ